MASCYTEPYALSACTRDEDENPQRSSSDESEESEPEPPLASAVRRRVSFADAFGLDLVSVKEFDNRLETAEGRDGDEYHLSCIFSVPASDEELVLRLQQNKLELESIEILPGSTTIRGTVRVLNLSYHKLVYVRVTLDGWQSHFDQLAEYVPGSSDGETDRFSFTLNLMPPFPSNGAKVEFCFCYESSTGHFWANNGGMNYVLFCHQRGVKTLKVKEDETERETEESNQKGKKSCLKAMKKGSCAESKPTDMSSELSEQESPSLEMNKKGKTQHKAESRSRDTLEESYKTLAERRNRRRAAQLACLQDYFSHRETDVQLVPPSHDENMKRELGVVLPMPQEIIPVITETSNTHQVWSRNEQNGKTSSILPDNQIPVLPLDSNSCTSSSSPTPTDTIIHGTTPNVPDKEQTEAVSPKLLSDAWKAFLSDAGSLDNHNNALDQKCSLQVADSNASQPSNTKHDVSYTGDKILSVWNSQKSSKTSGNGSHQCFTAIKTLEYDPVKLSEVLDPRYISEVLRLKCPKKSQISSEPHIVQESESIGSQWMPGNAEAPHDRHTCRQKALSEEKLMLLTEPEETAQAEDAIEPLNSQAAEECASSAVSSDTGLKVKGDTCQVVKDTLTFTGIRNKPCTDGRESLQRQHIDESREPKKKKEYIREETENGSQVKMISYSEYSKEDLVTLGSKLQDDDEEPFQVKDENTEVGTTSVVCEEGEPHEQTECLYRGEEAAVRYEFTREKGIEKGFSESSDRQVEEISFVENIADKEYENGLKTEGQGICINRKREYDEYKELKKELHKLQSSPETSLCSPNRCITSHTSNPGCRVAQDVQDLGVGTEFPSSYTRTDSISLGTMSSWLLLCWAKISTLSYITGPLVCAILFLIFVTAYLHDLPVCLAIYLLSACWWCRHGMKKHVTTAESVD